MQTMIVVDRRTGETIGGPFKELQEVREWIKERLVSRLPTGIIRRIELTTDGVQ